MNLRQFRRLDDRVYLHRGTPGDWLARHSASCAAAAEFGADGTNEISKSLFWRTSDERNIAIAIDHVGHQSGETAGPDGETFAGISEDVFGYARYLRDDVRSGEYRHGPARVIRVPKASGIGTRPIHILNFSDRVMHRAVVQVIAPLLENVFGSCLIYGGRPGKSREHALAMAEFLSSQQRPVWLCEDLADAFEHVPQRRLLDIANKYMPAPDFGELLEKMIITERRIGLRQGPGSSPPLLNLFLFHHLDRRWTKQPAPLLRYVDDLLVLCRTCDEAIQMREELKRILEPTGMRLKQGNGGATTFKNLHEGNTAKWLGFQIRAGSDGFHFGASVAQRWKEKLALLAAEGATPAEVGSRILNLAAQLGPTYEHQKPPKCHAWVVKTIAACGLTGVPLYEEFYRTWRGSYLRWQRIRHETRAVAIADDPTLADACGGT